MKKILVCLCLVFTALNISATDNKKADKEDKEDKEEKVEKEKFNRGIDLNTGAVFIPKGSIGAGVSFSYSNYDVGNSANDAGYSALFSLIKGVQGSMQTWGVAPFASYFLFDNFSIGARFDYSRTSLGLQNAGISISEISLSMSDFYYLKQSYTGAITGRYYIPIANSKRFGMFAEVRALGGYGQSETYNLEDGNKFGTYQDIYNFELGLVPGISVFVTNELAVEFSVGVLGLNYQKVEQVTNQVERSVMESSGANFKINLLSIGLGLSYYIQPGTKTPKKAKK